MNRWNTKGLLSTLLLAALLALALMTAPAFAQDSSDDAVDPGPATSAAAQGEDAVTEGDAAWYTHMWNGMQAGMGVMNHTMRDAMGYGMHMNGDQAGHPGAQHMGAGANSHGRMHGGMMYSGTMRHGSMMTDTSGAAATGE